MGERIYGKIVNIQAEEVQRFWSVRTCMFEEKGNSAVILGDQNPERVLAENEFDQKNIIPLLRITKDSRVLDVGCGVGRIAKIILPQCGFYLGTDYAEGMSEIAEQVCKQVKEENPEAGEYSIRQMSLSETVEKDPAYLGGKFDVYIMMGVCMYMNDNVLKEAFCRIPALLNDRSVILFQESMGLRQRLTLDRIQSEALQCDYTAIYRTKEEYYKLYEPLFEAGFFVAKDEQMPHFGNAYLDSERRFLIMKRG